MPKKTTIDKDLGYKKLIKEIKKFKGAYVKAGLPQSMENEVHSDDITTLQIGVWQEFGTRRIPKRPFIRTTFDTKKKQWEKFTDLMISGISLGKTTANMALDLLGQKILSDIKSVIRKGVGAKNAPSTLRQKQKKGLAETKRRERKGQPYPIGTPVQLIDTGVMLNSITYEKVIK